MSDLRTGETRLRRFIDATAALYQFPPWTYRGQDFLPGEWFEGQLFHESARGKLDARRYEPHQDAAGRKDQAQDGDRPGVDDGAREDDASYGLGQVMGYTFKGLWDVQPRSASLNYTRLFKPAIGITHAAEVLAEEFAGVYRLHPHAEDGERIVRVFCRYNGGPTGDAVDDATGDLRCRPYVNLVADAAAVVRTDRQKYGWKVAC